MYNHTVRPYILECIHARSLMAGVRHTNPWRARVDVALRGYRSLGMWRVRPGMAVGDADVAPGDRRPVCGGGRCECEPDNTCTNHR